MTKIKLSLILTTKGNINSLKPLFRTTDVDTELIIVDSEYNQETRMWLNTQLGFEKIIYSPVKPSPHTYYRDFSQGLNSALLLTENKWIIRVDDKLELKPDFFDVVRDDIDSFKDATGDENFAVIGQKLWGELNHQKWNDYFNPQEPSRYIKVEDPQFTFSFGIYPINLVYNLNGYDERYDIGWGYDDINFLHRILKAGYNVFFDRYMMAYSLPHKPKQASIPITRMMYEFEKPELDTGKIIAFNPLNFKETHPYRLHNKFEVTIAPLGEECISEWYDKTFIETDGWDEESELDNHIIQTIKNRYFRNEKLSLVDLGCGGGRTLSTLKDSGFEMKGVDFSKEALKKAKERNPNIKFFNQDMRKTSFKKQSFDIVLSIGCNEHHRKIDFSECRRIIKNDGLFVCVLPAHYANIGWSRKRENGQWEWLLTRDEWKIELEKAGFAIEKETTHGWLFTCYPTQKEVSEN